MGRAVRPAPDPALRRECRLLLRHHNDCAYLRRNAVVERIAQCADTAVGDYSDDALRDLVRKALEDAFASLSPLQETIVRRCDLGSERYTVVARALFVSERTAYRERDRALGILLDRVCAPRVAPGARALDGIAVFESHVSQARTLEQNGHWEAAAALLEGLAAASADGGLRCTVESLLARLYTRAECFGAAERHLRAARWHVANDATMPCWLAAAVDVSAAHLAESTGDSGATTAEAVRTSERLYSRSRGSLDVRIRGVVVEAMTLRATVDNGQGKFKSAADSASRAMELVRNGPAIDVLTATSAGSVAAMSTLFLAGDAEQAHSELKAGFEIALAAGLTQKALEIAANLAGLYRLEKRPRLAIDLLGPLVPVASLVGTRRDAAAVLYEIAAAHLEMRSFDAAAAYLPDLHTKAAGNARMQPVAEFLTSRVHLANGSYEPALAFAQDAEAGYARIGQERLAATSLRLQAEALARLGEIRRAIHTVKRAIDLLSGHAHPARLAKAYRLLAALSCDATYLRKARDLLASRC